MDLVRESDEPTTELGTCIAHSRLFECYCNQCNIMICPSCLMFGDHKGHNVCKIEEGAKDLRRAINASAKEGYLKFERTENVLLDIRHVKLSLEENQEKIVSEIESSFDELIMILKTRKSLFTKQILQEFNNEIQKIENIEADWINKQELCQKILTLQASPDDLKLLEEGKQIVLGLEELSKVLEYREISLIESLKAESVLGKNVINFGEIKNLLKGFMEIGEPTLNKLKC